MQVEKKTKKDAFWSSNALSFRDILVINGYLLAGIVFYGIVFWLLLKKAGLNISQYKDLLIYILWAMCIIAVYRLRIKSKDMFELRIPPSRDVTFVFSLIFFVLFTKGLARILVQEYMLVDKNDARLLLSVDDISMFLFHAFIGVTLGPLVEEIIFRGFFFPALRRRFDRWHSIVFTSLLFAMWHIGSGIENILCIFSVGLLLGFIFEKTRCLFLSVIAHSFFNLNWIIALYFSAHYQQYILQGLEVTLTVSYLVLFIVCAFFNKRLQTSEVVTHSA